MQKIYGYKEKDVKGLAEFITGRKRGALTEAFGEYAEMTGKARGTVRNMYYALAKLSAKDKAFCDEYLGGKPLEVEKIVTFGAEEEKELITSVVKGRAEGKSVRRVIMEITSGDAKKSLRFQNKYRGIMKNKPELIESVRKKLAAQGELPLRTDDKRAFKVVSRGTGALPETQLKRLKAEINGLMMRVAAGIRKENAVLKDKLAALEIENLRLKNTLYGNGGKNSAMRFLSKGKNGGGGATAES